MRKKIEFSEKMNEIIKEPLKYLLNLPKENNPFYDESVLEKTIN